MSDRRRRVLPPYRAKNWDGLAADAVVEVGDGEQIGVAVHSRKALRRYSVYLAGQRVGTVEQYERRGTRPLHRGSRIVTVTGWPVEWAWGSGDRVRYGLGYPQLNEAVGAVLREVSP